MPDTAKITFYDLMQHQKLLENLMEMLTFWVLELK